MATRCYLLSIGCLILAGCGEELQPARPQQSLRDHGHFRYGSIELREEPAGLVIEEPPSWSRQLLGILLGGLAGWGAVSVVRRTRGGKEALPSALLFLTLLAGVAGGLFLLTGVCTTRLEQQPRRLVERWRWCFGELEWFSESVPGEQFSGVGVYFEDDGEYEYGYQVYLQPEGSGRRVVLFMGGSGQDRVDAWDLARLLARRWQLPLLPGR